jgi:hypothetical protein
MKNEAAEKIVRALFDSPADWRELVKLTGMPENEAKKLLCEFFELPDFFN